MKDFDLKELVESRFGENYILHDRYVNRTFATVLKTIGFDKCYKRAKGAYLYDADGNVSTITTDSLKINRIARDTAYLSQENLTKMSAEGIQVPLGAFTGIEALAGFGAKVNIKIIPISNVECRFVSKFEEAGINQTKHSLYLEIVSDISIIMPSRTSNLASTIEVLICESIINGKIPDAYLQASVAGGGALVPATP